ncbi:CDP-alcohol phosphatidyltransferase family protein [uncultured Methanobrevibacter sp.]|uniref:CDP-alcohol phosphatidyltransferase family protein n=1 Tax=uncultured Methanobrevibacter sp. TaxID=253161 RepID=UPI0025DA392D|nr:CDP-alcohol phosphatidyltransferase family protein [uncultured Methanobrevibacter sp.]
MNRHIINALSLSRILFGLLFLYFVVFDFNIINLMVIFSLTIVSDVLDGYWARKYNLVMDEGSKVDVICDFLFIIFSTLALVLIDLAPSWFLIVIVLKLIEFFMTSGRGALKYDKFGTYVAYMFYAFPIVAILINSKIIILILSIVITVCAITSSFLRIKDMRELND